MKKLLFLFIFLIVFSYASVNVKALVTLDSCTYLTTGSAALFRATDNKNAHIATPSFGGSNPGYDYIIQCSGTNIQNNFGDFSGYNPTRSVVVGSLYDTNNTHMYLGQLSNGLNAILSEVDPVTNPGLSCGDLSGTYGGDGQAECVAAGWDVCVFSGSDSLNAHVASCSGPDSYQTKRCCRVGPPPSGPGPGNFNLLINPKVSSRNINAPVRYQLYLNYTNGSFKTVFNEIDATWTTSNPSVVCDVIGRCLGSSLGTFTITANYSGQSATATLNVVNSPGNTPSNLDLLPFYSELSPTQQQTYTLKVYYVNGSSSDITNDPTSTYNSLNPTIFTLTSNVGTAQSPGNTEVIGSWGGLSINSYVTVTNNLLYCNLNDAQFTWTDPSTSFEFDLGNTLQSSGTPVNLTTITNQCAGFGKSISNVKLYQYDCANSKDVLINTFTNIPVNSNDKANQDITLNFDTVRGPLGCPNNEAQYFFESNNIVPSGGARPVNGITSVNSSIIYVNDSVYSGGGPCTTCGGGGPSGGSYACPVGTGSPSWGCWIVPSGFGCVNLDTSASCGLVSGYTSSYKCCQGLIGGLGDIKTIITRAGQCVDINRNDGTGQVEETWRRVNITSGVVLEERKYQKECLLAKPANVPVFSIINIIIVGLLITGYYIYSSKKVKYKKR